MVRVLVALAYRLVLGSAEAPGGSGVVEEAKALGEVSAELPENQPTKTGHQEKQSWRGERQHLPPNHQAESSSLRTQKRLSPLEGFQEGSFYI